MRKAILTVLGSVLLVASVAQAASATERYHGRRVACACIPAPVPQQFRDSSGTVWTPEPGWPPLASGYYSHGFSAPAGR
jgi:hypothetical protein